MTASLSGFGTPFLFVFPSSASANIVSSSDSNCSAGRDSPAPRTICGRLGVDLGVILTDDAGKSALVRKDNGLHAIAHIELRQDMRYMRLHRRLADEQFLRDLRVRQPLRDELQHL